MIEAPSPAERQIIRKKAVKEKTGLSDTTIWRAVHAATFPAPIQLTENRIGWYADEVEAWLASRPRVNYAPAAA